MSAPPRIPADLQTRVDLHHVKTRNLELEFKIAELQLQLADRAAALASIELTKEREELAVLLNTTDWYYDFDAHRFVSRTTPQPMLVPVEPPSPPAPQPPLATHVEAVFQDGRVIYAPRPCEVSGPFVDVRARYDAAQEPAFDRVGRAAIAKDFARCDRVTITAVPVTSLNRGS